MATSVRSLTASAAGTSIQLLQDGKVMAQVPYFVKRSVVGIPKLR